MIKILGSLPKTSVYIACSGGVDSMFAVDFLNTAKRKVNLVFVDHLTSNSANAKKFLLDFAEQSKLKLDIHPISPTKDKKQSWEEFWRVERYKIFRLYPEIITAHHLDDAVETYIWRAAHGRLATIAYRNKNVIRPFLLNRKKQLKDWLVKKDIKWVDDVSNIDDRYIRNHIRHNLVPQFEKVNKGIYKTVSKLIISDLSLDRFVY